MVLGAIVGTVLSCFIGAFWYSPMFLGKPWMRVNYPGKTINQIDRETSHAMYITLLSCSTMALLLQFIFVNVFHTTSIVEAASIGFGLACLIFLASVSHCAFANRSFLGFIIDHAFNAAIITVMAVSIVYCNNRGFEIPFLSGSGLFSSSGGKKSGQ